MNKFGIVLAHTYFSKLKSKAFIISTLIAMVVMIGLANIESIIAIFKDDEPNVIAVIDESDILYQRLGGTISTAIDELELVEYEDTVENGKEAVQREEYVGLLHLQTDENNIPLATFYTNRATESMAEGILIQQLQQIRMEIATENAGIDEATFTSIFAEVSFEKISLDEKAKTDEELSQTRGIVYVMLFVLYITIIVYGQMIATDVATEKSSRVMEILISSAQPITHMFAKIIGIALLGLTQIFILFLVSYAMVWPKLKDMSNDFVEVFGFEQMSISIYIYALLFFILGYLLYATIAAMLGSIVSRVEDVGQLLFPMIFLIMVAFFIAMFGLNVPDAKFVTITSFIPFFSPMIMFLRVGMLEVPFWEVALSVVILIATIILFALLGARIYRGGVLMYGPSKTLKDFKNAFQLTKK